MLQCCPIDWLVRLTLNPTFQFLTAWTISVSVFTYCRPIYSFNSCAFHNGKLLFFPICLEAHHYTKTFSSSVLVGLLQGSSTGAPHKPCRRDEIVTGWFFSGRRCRMYVTSIAAISPLHYFHLVFGARVCQSLSFQLLVCCSC